MRSIVLGMVVLGCLALSRSGVADDSAEIPYKFALPTKKEARERLKRGARLYEVQSFEAAIDEFKAGAIAEPCSTFDYDLGQSYRMLGRYKEALWHYERFLDNGKPTGDVLLAVQKWMNEMQAHLANAALTMPPREAAPATQPESSAPSPTPRVAASPTQAATQHGTVIADDRDGSASWLGWPATAGGVVALGATAYLFLRSSNLYDQANSTPDTRTRIELRDQAGTRRVAGAIVGVGGVVLTATGIYMLVTSRHHSRSTTASLDVGITGRGVIVIGRF